jgi:putative transposase
MGRGVSRNPSIEIKENKMTEYRRYRLKGGTYFFTVNLAERKHNLLIEHIDDLRNAFREIKHAHPFRIDAIAVMPDHLHTLWTLPEDDDDFSLRWRQIKSAFSRQIEKGERLSKSRTRKQERGIWRRRFWEHAIRNENDYARHVDYIHFNPVKHGYVRQVVDWPYSSFHRYVKLGLCSSDWSGIETDDLDYD